MDFNQFNRPPQQVPQTLPQSMNRERIQAMVQRLNILRSQGQNERTSTEFAQMAGFLRMFGQFQQMRQQQLQQQQQQQGAPQQAPQSLTPVQINALKAQMATYQFASQNMPTPEHIQREAFEPAQYPVAPPPEDTIRDKTIGAAVEINKVKEETPQKPHEYQSYISPLVYLEAGPNSSNNSTKNQRIIIPSVMPQGIDPYQLIEERNHFQNRRMYWRIQELEDMTSTTSDQPAHITGNDILDSKAPQDIDQKPESPSLTDVSSSDKMKALIELKALKLVEKQRALRQDVISAQSHATLLTTDRAAFRRFKKQSLRDARATEQFERKQRSERDRKSRQKHLDYILSIHNHANNLRQANRDAVAKAQKMGRAVLKLHGDVEKEEQKRVERVSKERLAALRNDDEEAYLKLIDTAKDTRITHLLSQTDAYLDSLTQNVLAQQNEVGMEDNFNFEVEEAPATEATFGGRRQDDEAEDQGKVSVDYYAVAHRVSEKVTTQPSILIGGQLKEYQLKGLQWMISLYNNRLNGILADEMGLGKTIQTISLVTFLIERKRQNGPYLIIVPLSTLTNWAMEFEKWAPSVSVAVYKGPPQQRKATQQRMRQGFQVLLTTFEYVIKDRPVLSKYNWVFMIMDEGHRLKNTESKLSQTLQQFYKTRYRLILTGTPLQNNLPELWALLNFVLPKIFNSVKSFDEWFNTPFANTGSNEKMDLNEEESLLVIKRLHKVLRPFLLRRLKKDVEKDLPDKVEKVVKCRMSPLQISLYNQMKKFGQMASISQSDKNGAVGGNNKSGIKGLQNTIMQLRKIVNHPFVFDAIESAVNPASISDDKLYRVAGKFELLDRILPKLKATGHRVLIFFQMTAIMTIMEDYLAWKGLKHLRLDGSTKTEERSSLLNKFNDLDSDYFVFLLSTRAGGLGLNLQSADTVIIFDSDWNPHADLQAQDRAHRIGQKKEVRILRLITERSVEEQILARAQYKLEIDGKVIQAGKFDNKSTAEEREDFLRSILEQEAEEEEEAGDMNDDEINELLARGEGEIDVFNQMDKERAQQDALFWQAKGLVGPNPGRLITDQELPEIYRSTYEWNPIIEADQEALEGGRRARAGVVYDDGLTEEQWVNALENDETTIEEQSRLKRERAAKGLTEEEEIDSPDVDGSKKRSGRPSKVGTPVPGGKRKRNPAVETPTIDYNDEPANKKKKPGLDPEAKERLKSVLTPFFDVVWTLTDEDGRLRADLFREVPSKKLYPDYALLIKQPMALNNIKRKIERKTYQNARECLSDFHLMFANARTYNEPGSWVVEDADAIQAGMDQAWNEKVLGTGVAGSELPAEATGPPQPDQILGPAALQAVAQPMVQHQVPQPPQPQNQMVNIPQMQQQPQIHQQMPQPAMQAAPMYQQPSYGAVDPNAFIADPMYYQQQAYDQQQQQQAAFEQQQQQQMYQSYGDPYGQQPHGP
ncbi:hypothetical protein E3Q22_00227 [Wallemia mellicola]|uniref:SNF2-family ATP dependent chromatin remodeling factor snf21 n=2 Tax=Wallemia mellicola TaxID=1708541 RepID=A0A4T0P041_9BASI|nr:hypothetical protein WALSEDRAFT_59530 [Wallemia mellicola CBS 633.66]TIB78270.1 hypothetical protein E3Q23_00890 [Wallemia mellicola]EIM23270.1 hypothetical protein WALSEDRAFT_59530 [Wallemia mellicola CBS 633.66]TIB82362.1 hypothetical protein E3Q22_00227 [Wallemia mellicola]TIC03350.1 hypothetical protein E3Q17_00971 [Wallemia mellicola]TIC20978.1 hypothetical protein E3Q13_00120 [Wallemia mellicola]|eukprot:XP_006956660.1 hypothetical protein WALSEDRAFT_59530 [Wallemia mellicola CBS 633.66]